jgi:hypothetical protein
MASEESPESSRRIDNDRAESEVVVGLLGSAYVLEVEEGVVARGAGRDVSGCPSVHEVESAAWSSRAPLRRSYEDRCLRWREVGGSQKDRRIAPHTSCTSNDAVMELAVAEGRQIP